MKTLKYTYNRVIQQHCGNGWDDVSAYMCNSTYTMTKDERGLLNADLKEYKLMGYPTRVINRRTLN